LNDGKGERGNEEELDERGREFYKDA